MKKFLLFFIPIFSTINLKSERSNIPCFIKWNQLEEKNPCKFFGYDYCGCIDEVDKDGNIVKICQCMK